MQIKWLEDFLSLSDTRSFSQAADERHVTQSALSRRIMSLEEWLGVKLVDRTVQPAALTPAGWMFRGLAADILRQMYAARALLKGQEPLTNDDEVVQFSVAHTLAINFFPNWLQQLNKRYGAITARALAVNVPEGVQQLVDGDIDLLLGYHHRHLPIVLDPNQFPHIVLGSDRIRPFSATDRQGRPLFELPGADHAPLPLVSYSAGAFLGNVVEMILLDAPAVPYLRHCFATHMSEALKAMVVAGHGIGWLPESCVIDELASQKLASAAGDADAAWSTELEVRLYRSVANLKPAAKRLWSYVASTG
jgi:LysR family transcriptional regulator, hypochlorite-specific transcription factor HypT